jgi:hypothetical protein
MPDIRRIVSLSAGGRPIVALDLEQTDIYKAERGTFQFTPGPKSAQVSGRGGRYGGGRIVGETRDFARVGWTMRVKATSADQLNQRMEDLLGQVESVRRGRLLEWRPDGATGSSFLRIAGPGEWTSNYQWVEYQEDVMGAQVSWPVDPLVEWAPCTIRDDFSANSISDYTFDAMTSASVAWNTINLLPSGTLTTERRARHTARGYDFATGQATIYAFPVTTITNYKVGVLLRAVDATNYVEVYIDDNGTNSRLRIDVRTGGAPVNRASTNLAARLVSSGEFRLRGRIEGNTVTAEYFLAAAEPTPMGAPTLTNSYTLSSGEQTSLPRGDTGFSWIPQNAAAPIDEFYFCPYVRRNVSFPVTPGTLQFTDLPGRAPAKADITLTTSAPTQAPIFALIGWAPSTGIAPVAGVKPLGLIEAETGGDLSGGWVSTAEANTSNGSSLRQSGFSGAKVYVASYTVDPHTLVVDEFEADTVAIEVWSRVGLDAAVVTPKVRLWAQPADGISFGAERWSAEYGIPGKLLTKPSSGAAWRFSKFGTLTLPSDTLRPRAWKVFVELSCAAGSSGLFGLDYLFLVPARSRVLGPTSKVRDASYPLFIGTTSQTSKTIRHDLSGLIGSPPNNPNPDAGLGGNLIEIPLGTTNEAGPGTFDLAVKLAPHVPDDPTLSTNSESAVASPATVQLDVTPRSYLLRG